LPKEEGDVAYEIVEKLSYDESQFNAWLEKVKMRKAGALQGLTIPKSDEKA